MNITVKEFIDWLCIDTVNTNKGMIRFEVLGIPMLKSGDIYFKDVDSNITIELENAYVHHFHIEYNEDYGIFTYVVYVEF